jgi:hypothetical protein
VYEVDEEKDVAVLPAQIRVLRVLIGVQLYRLVGVSLLQFSATLPSAFLIPTVTGDALTAVFAPIIAIAVSTKHGPRTWAAALLWNVLGMVDLFYALALAMLTTAGSFILSSYQIVFVGAILGILLHITSIVLLLRKGTMSYLLNPV